MSLKSIRTTQNNSLKRVRQKKKGGGGGGGNKVQKKSKKISNVSIHQYYRAGKMSQWVKVLVTKANDLSLIPKIHIVDGGNEFLQAVF